MKINFAQLEVYTDIKKDVKKITPWYKRLWKKITGKK